MKVVYAITRWTNPSRPTARHIPNAQGKPLCGNKRMKRIAGYEYEYGEPTCDTCKRIYKQSR